MCKRVVGRRVLIYGAGNGPGPNGKAVAVMRDETLLAMFNDPENYFEDGVLYGPGFGERVELVRVNMDAAKDYVGPVPRWVTRRGLKLWDVVANQYETGEPAMVITPDGFKAVDGTGVYPWATLLEDYEGDLDVFFDALIKFDRS